MKRKRSSNEKDHQNEIFEFQTTGITMDETKMRGGERLWIAMNCESHCLQLFLNDYISQKTKTKKHKKSRKSSFPTIKTNGNLNRKKTRKKLKRKRRKKAKQKKTKRFEKV